MRVLLIRSTLNKIVMFLILVGVVLFALELCLDYWIYPMRDRSENRQYQSYYSWELHARSGELLGTRHGELQLEYHPLLVYRNRPNQVNARFSINSLGLRGKEVASKRAHKKRIFLIGDSTAFGTGLNSDDETMAIQLEKLSANIEVINGSVIGYQSAQQLVHLASVLDILQPDLVLTLRGAMDCFGSSITPAVGGDYQLEETILLSDRLRNARTPIRMAHFNQFFFPKISQEIHRLRENFKKTSDDCSADGLLAGKTATFVRNAIKMSRFSRAFSADFQEVIQPLYWKKSKNGSFKMCRSRYDQFRTNICGQLRNAHVSCMDLNDHLSEFPLSVFLDESHLDAKGNGILARLIAKELGFI